MPGIYERTEEIREKQSQAAKQNYIDGVYNVEERAAKLRSTFEAKKAAGERVGRKSKEDGGVYNKAGVYKPCPVCGIGVYYKPKEVDLDKRKCCSRKCLSKDPVFISKLKSIKRSYPRPGLRNPNQPEFRKYKNDVHRMTQKVYEENIDAINPNRYTRTLCGVDGGWQLDHIKSVKECFSEGWTVEQASDVSNLRMLPWQDNLMRNYERSLQENNIS